MEIITISQVREAGKKDPISGEYLDLAAFYGLGAQYVQLYDPPVGGATPEDGAGKPATSFIGASQALGALDKGFTEKPVK